MGITTNREDPGLNNIDDRGMQKKYLVLSEEEIAKGFVRPVRYTYVHVGLPPIMNPLRDLTIEEHERYDKYGYIKYEEYPWDGGSVAGRLWTQARLDKVNKGCGVATRMGPAIAETYARKPNFYGGTYCVGCNDHFPVGKDGEFVWEGTVERVGT